MSTGSKFYDTAAAMQLIGCLLVDPTVLYESGKYSLTETDFCNDFHKILVGSINNMIMTGVKNISINAIEDYLHDREKSYAIYKANKGSEYLYNVFMNADIMNFDYYYQRIKKMTLLRTYNGLGIDVSWIYDPDSLDLQVKEEGNNRVDELSIEEIADLVDNKVISVRETIIDGFNDDSCNIGDGLDELLERLDTDPVRGYNLFDPVLDKVALGARLGTFYLRSASTGVGKSRSAMADACYMACSSYYDENKGWVNSGEKIPSLFISVELDKEELQTMALSFISGVPENRILEPILLQFDEQDRLKQAVKVLQESALIIEYLPDYSIRDIENCIKRNLRVHKTQAVFMDYITTSMSMIEELTRASGGMKLREDQVLFQFSSKLKDLAGQYQIFIFSSTQLNAGYKVERNPDQTLLAGAKAIANRIDFGCIMLDVTEEDLEDLNKAGNHIEQYGEPNIKCSIYKNRRGQWNRIILWMRADKSTCRYKTIFVTDFFWKDITPLV